MHLNAFKNNYIEYYLPMQTSSQLSSIRPLVTVALLSCSFVCKHYLL